MNKITKIPLAALGYQFVEAAWLPPGKDEYYLRNEQNGNRSYRSLTAAEITALKQNGNSSDNWSNVLVSEKFDTALVQQCRFYGLVRIGNLEPFLLSYSELKMPVGLYGSTIISSDFGDHVAIHNNDYISHYIFGAEVIVLNVNELLTTPHAKFGNGIVKEGEPESVRIRLELCNENAGRSVLPFDGMLPGDAWLWSKYRDNEPLMQAFTRFTETKFDHKRGYYGTIGDRTVIKNCKIIKDVRIGSDAYLKGANKIKNVTINSAPKAKSQVGEGCEIVNGIIGYGCRIFYGVKAVRFIMADQSQLKYGARLINSYLGSNATISCCEVLNSLIFPAHEQHHNNSFLCASVVMGQSNIAAGATIGSNHNSRSPDGELVAGRGFWPGLCVSLKHNSRFASYTILAKGDYPAELDIRFPFALVSNDVTHDRLQIMPAYWFMYNMYALARNAWKYIDRDKRIRKYQHIEYDYLAPDTINEIFDAFYLLEQGAGKAWLKKENRPEVQEEKIRQAGRDWLRNKGQPSNDIEVSISGAENTKRQTLVLKPREAYGVYTELVILYAVTNLLEWMEKDKIQSYDTFARHLPTQIVREQWVNAGGQLMPQSAVDQLMASVVGGRLQSWDELHQWFESEGRQYPYRKLLHSLAALQEVIGKKIPEISRSQWLSLFQQSLATRTWMVENISASRKKDYENPFRNMVYNSPEEMEKVLGKFTDNSFIRQENEGLQTYRLKMDQLMLLFTESRRPVAS